MLEPSPDNASTARLFAALGDETRLRLVSRLCDGPRSITGLTSGFDVSRQAITKHLRVMEEAGLVHVVRSGRESVWQLTPGSLSIAQRHLDVISGKWDQALERLQTFVEK